ncbi:MAG: hypothetical protein E6J90_05920 [Deltaproteobacteria bacterium]|nr:MAG: hypothetical protein E6J90_05920 [Deltaproteobacteria bacterium]
MRATSTVVALSSLLVAASAAAQSTPKDADKKPPAATSGTTAKTGSGTAKTGGGTAAKTGAGTAKTGAKDAGASSPAAATGDTGTAGSGPAGTGTPAPPAPEPDLAAVKPEDMPTAVRMRRLEQKTQALKERAWQLKARVQMLKEQVLGGGVGAQAVVAHGNEMGASFRLTKLIYTLDGTQVFARTDDTAENLYKSKAFDVFAGPISPGNHNLSAIATYRGHGYGVFEYLSKYTFTAKGNQAFLAGEGKIAKIDCRGFEKGGPTTPLEKRASIECKVTQVQPEKPADKDKPAEPAARTGAPAATAPGSTAPAGTQPPAPATPPANPSARSGQSAAGVPGPSGPSGKCRYAPLAMAERSARRGRGRIDRPGRARRR